MQKAIIEADKFSEKMMRRFRGEFFTPLTFAHKALLYLEEVIGEKWWATGKYRLWDMAAGKGNLCVHLPTEALQYCYLSTLLQEDTEDCQRLFPQAQVFQYDYLNDDTEKLFADEICANTWKLPQKLQQDLKNPAIHWIIFINPPFATAQKGGAVYGERKTDVSDTAIRTIMHQHDLGEVSRELAMQFVFRIRKEFKNKAVFLGLFYKLKYINSYNDQKLRDRIFKCTFKKGFMFSSANFVGTSKASPFPVGFLVWDLSAEQNIEEQVIQVDILNDEAEKIGQKQFKAQHRDKFLSKWIQRPTNSLTFPPLGGAITLKKENKDIRDKISTDFLASLMAPGNDFQQQSITYFLSAPSASAGGLSVTPTNFEQAMIVHAVRRIPKATWLNDRDQFMQPTQALPQEFVIDCAVWNLYSISNQTSALKDVAYQEKIYQIRNHFFPFLKTTVAKWELSNPAICSSFFQDTQERFMALWLQNQIFSAESQAVLRAGEALWQFYYSVTHQLNLSKFQIATWDAGWWQIRNALAEQNLAATQHNHLRETHNLLKNKLLPQMYDLGFLS